MTTPRSFDECDDAARRMSELFASSAERLGVFARRRTSPTDADDVVAETFLVAWRRRHDIPPGRAAVPWLYGVARRVIANQRRSTARRRRLQDRLSAAGPRDVQIEPLEHEEGIARIEAALRRLDVDDVRLLRLAAGEQLTPAQISAVLGVSAVVVRQRLHRARRRLRRHLEAG